MIQGATVKTQYWLLKEEGDIGVLQFCGFLILECPESHLMIAGKHVLDMLVEWIQNNFINVRHLDVCIVQVWKTMALMPPPLVTYNMENWTRIVCSKPNLTLTYWESREKYRTQHDSMYKNRTGNKCDNRRKNII